jgi:hypothetical protein
MIFTPFLGSKGQADQFSNGLLGSDPRLYKQVNVCAILKVHFDSGVGNGQADVYAPQSYRDGSRY